MEVSRIGSGEYSVVYTETNDGLTAYKCPVDHWEWDDLHIVMREGLLLRFGHGPKLLGIVCTLDRKFAGLQMERFCNIITNAEGPLSVWEARIQCLVVALQGLHASGWIHGDIKVSNILVRGTRAVFCDFGLSFYDVRDLNASQDHLLCTIAYRAPEFLESRRVDPKEKPTKEMDIWALGLSVLYALTGNPFTHTIDFGLQFVHTSMLRLYGHHIPEDHYARLTLYKTKFGESIGTFLAYALEWNPKARRLVWESSTTQHEITQELPKHTSRPVDRVMHWQTVSIRSDWATQDVEVLTVQSIHKSMCKYFAMKPIFESNVLHLAGRLAHEFPEIETKTICVVASLFVIVLVRPIRFSDVSFFMRLCGSMSMLQLEDIMKQCLCVAINAGPQWTQCLFAI